MRELPVAGTNLRDIINAINQLIRGRSNATSSVTLNANATTTIVTGDNINASARVFLFPMTAAAGTEVGNGTIYASVTIAGTATITHANTASTTRTFALLVTGG